MIHITQKEKKESAINPKKAPKTRKEIQRFILEAFPGVGPKASQKLLETVHTLQNIFAAQKKDIEKVTNKRVAASICELLR